MLKTNIFKRKNNSIEEFQKTKGVVITQYGNFKNTVSFLKGLKEIGEDFYSKTLPQMAEECLRNLKKATPVDSGKTSESWYYKIKRDKKITKLTFYNSNVVDGINIALLIEFGHATPEGRWIEGRDYIEPAIAELYKKALEVTWGEIKGL